MIEAQDEDAFDPCCVRCGIDCMPLDTEWGAHDWQYYMVHDEIWAQTGLGKDDGLLCISCLQKAIGRRLSGRDFMCVPINLPGARDDTPYLYRLKMAAMKSWEMKGLVR